jgi:tetratricopeptide (TPR) repeat protein
MIYRITTACLLLVLLALPVLGQETPGREAPPVVTISPDQAVERARTLHQMGQTAEALDLLKSALKLAPGNIEALLLAADILMASNDYDLAREYFKQVLDKEPSNFKANLGTGRIWLANKYWRQAVSFLEKAENVAPQESRSEAKRLLAGAYAQIGQFEKAIAKATEAIQAAPDDLDALMILVQIRQALLTRDPQQIEPALADAEKYVQRAAQAVARSPLDGTALDRLEGAYAILVSPPPNMGILQFYHNSFYQKDPRGQTTNKLLPGKGADAAAVLMRIADVYRQQALLKLVGAEHDAILLIETAVKDDYDPKNVKYLEQLALAYQQLQDLTAKLVGPQVYADQTLPGRAIDVCRKILELDPGNERAQQYLRNVGAPPTSQPAPGEK